MNQTLKNTLASIANGLMFPFLLYGFQITPWSTPLYYWNAALVSFAVTFLVYKYRQPVEGRSAFKTYLINFLISFLVLCGIVAVYFIVLAILYALI